MGKEALPYAIRVNPVTRYKIIYSFVVLLTIVWCLLFTITPILCHTSTAWKRIGTLTWLFFGLTCHQIPERSFHLYGYPFAVCARCTGIYFGFLLGLLLYPMFKKWEKHELPSWKWLFWAGLPAGLEFIFSKLGILNIGLILRSFSGMIIGGTVAFFIMPALYNLVDIR